MKGAVKFFSWIEVFLGVLFLAGCETVPEGIQQAKIAMAQSIQEGKNAPSTVIDGTR